MGEKINRKMLKTVIGKSVRTYRNKQNLTLEKLASLTNLNDKHLGRIERGEKLPNSKTLITLQLVLKFSTDELIPKYKRKVKKLKKKNSST